MCSTSAALGDSKEGRRGMPIHSGSKGIFGKEKAPKKEMMPNITI